MRSKGVSTSLAHSKQTAPDRRGNSVLCGALCLPSLERDISVVHPRLAAVEKLAVVNVAV